MLKSYCLGCGAPCTGTRCEQCRLEHNRVVDKKKVSYRNAGYNSKWDALSKRARKLQPWCTDCHTTEKLSLDHLPGAWERSDAGKPLRLGIDVEVVCLACNNRRGKKRVLKHA